MPLEVKRGQKGFFGTVVTGRCEALEVGDEN